MYAIKQVNFFCVLPVFRRVHTKHTPSFVRTCGTFYTRVRGIRTQVRIMFLPRVARGTSARVFPSSRRSFSGCVELREYIVKPQFIGDYMKVSTEGGDLRKRLVPLRLFGVPETGDTLNLAQHFYYYDNLQERQQARDAAQADPEWQAYIGTIRPHLAQQKSTIFVEPCFVSKLQGVKGMRTETVGGSSADDAPGLYELRRYTVSRGLAEFWDVSKAVFDRTSENAQSGSGTELCTVLEANVGLMSEVRAWLRTACVRASERTYVVSGATINGVLTDVSFAPFIAACLPAGLCVGGLAQLLFSCVRADLTYAVCPC